MATPLSADETARLILKAMVFKAKFRAGEAAPVGAVYAAAKHEGLDPQDLEGGLEHAIKQGWVTRKSAASVTLTDDGFAAAPTGSVNRHDALREIAQHAREVAELIHQPGHRDAGQFQTEVREMQSHGPDVELRDIQGQHGAVAASIEAYLRNQAV